MDKYIICYWYSIFCNIITSAITLFFFIILIYSLIISNNANIYGNSLKKVNIDKVISILFLLITLILYLIKFIGNFWITTSVNLNSMSNIVKLGGGNLFSLNYLNTGYSLFSDVIVILCLIVTYITIVYLSDRGMLENTYNISYFMIFTIFTINMVYSTNLLTMFIFFEFIFLPSLYFVYQIGYSEEVDKTVKYLLIWTLTGSFLVVCGLTYLYSIVGTLSLSSLYWIQFSSTEGIMLFLCFFLGFGIKIPLWPFHFWLTKVHVEAPTGFSIFLSGYLVKTAFFCLTYFCIIFKTKLLCIFAITITLWGAVDSSFRMWTADDVKRLIAFATIQEMNLLLGLFFLVNNSYLHTVNIFLLVHGVLSALLFYLIEMIQRSYRTRNLSVISGLTYLLPILHTIIWLSILVFRGFPIFIKFFIEWEILSILMSTYSFWGFILFAVITIYGVLGFCRIWLTMLYGQPNNIQNSSDMFKKDIYIFFILISILFILNFIIIFF